MAVACGVDADADAVKGSGGSCGHEDSPRKLGTGALGGHWDVGKRSQERRELPPRNLWRGDPCDKRSSRRMYQSLEPKIGGSNLFQEVKASGDRQISSRRFHHYCRWLEMSIQGGQGGLGTCWDMQGFLGKYEYRRTVWPPASAPTCPGSTTMRPHEGHPAWAVH